MATQHDHPDHLQSADRGDLGAAGVKPAAPLLSLAGVTKVYGPVEALRSVDMTVRRGSIHGLVGSNGAGKSTVMKILSGVVAPTSGVVTFRGAPVVWRGPHEAAAAGVGTAHQHAALAPTLSALENVFLAEPGWRRHDPRLRSRYLELQQRVGCDVDPDTVVAGLPTAQQQLLAIMRAISSRETPELVILDEPTAPLSARERTKLFTIMRQLAASGIAVIFCSHFLDEVLAITDEVTVLRDGQVVSSGPTRSVDEQSLVELIVGHEILEAERTRFSPPAADAEVALQVDGLRLYPGGGRSTFSVRAGEVVGIAGLVGSGRSRLLRTLAGAATPQGGSVTFYGTPSPTTVAAAVKAGIALVPEDRNRQALMGQWEIWRNASLPSLGALSHGGFFLSARREKELAAAAVSQLSIRTPSVDMLVSRLSGGNAQKVVLAKWFGIGPRLLLLDDPVVGVDVSAKADIMAAIRQRAEETGCAVLVVSSEFDELLAVASRVLVQRRGAIVGDLPADGLDKTDLVALASGVSTRQGALA